MADAGLFIGWGSAVRGREKIGLDVFNEAIEYFGGLQQQGEVESFEAIFLEPHGGDLGGFFLVRGERDKIARIRASDELNRISVRAGQVVESFGVVGASLGDGIPPQLELYQTALDELT